MIAAATARGYIEEHTDADLTSILFMGNGSARKSRKHWTFQYRERTSGNAKVVHLITRDDVTDERLFESEAKELRNLPGAAPQIVIEAAGDVVLIVRDYLELLSGVPAADEIQFAVARDYLQQILRTLSQWHSRGVYHGDLRPENIAVRGRDIQFVDFFARLPVEELGSGRLDYVAPELRSGARRGSMAGDIYSFARLSVELLRPFRGNLQKPAAAELERRLAWLADFAYVAEPEERPAAHEILSRYFTDPRASALERWQSAVRPSSRSRAADASNRQLDRAPQPRRHLSPFQFHSGDEIDIAKLQAIISLDKVSGIEDSEDDDKNYGSGLRNLGSLVEKSSLGDNIDSRWRTSIHRLHFGHGFDRDHDRRTNPRPLDPALVARDAFYDWHLESSRRIRQSLLDKNDFLFTDDVVRLLARRTPNVVALDITALRFTGALLAVPDHDRWIFPAFQFDLTGRVDPDIQRVNDLLRHSNGLPEDEWSILALWSMPQESLGGVSLREALASSSLDELIPSVLPEFLNEPPYWFNAPPEIRTMAVVESSMRSEQAGALQGKAGEEIVWDRSGPDLVLRWSANSSLDDTLESFDEFVQARPVDSLGAIGQRSGLISVMSSHDTLQQLSSNDDLDLLRLDLDRMAFVWEAIPEDPDLPAADITAIFHPSQAEKVEVMVRRTGTPTVRECARVAIQSVLHRDDT